MKTPQEARDVVFRKIGNNQYQDENGKEGCCATYVWRMAKYIINGTFSNTGSGAQWPRDGFSTSNLSDSGCKYSNALNTLNYVKINSGTTNRTGLINYCENNLNFQPGDIVNYWHITQLFKENKPNEEESCSKMGHTQIYLGGGIWESSYKYNYAGKRTSNAFVYRKKGNAGDMWFFQVLRLNGVPAYDSNLCQCDSCSDNVTYESNQPLDKSPAGIMKRAVYCARYLMNNLSMTKEQACGVVGNFLQEDSTLDPETENNLQCYGIVQWCDARKDRLKSMRPNDYNTIDGQLAFVRWEMTTPETQHGERGAYNAIMQTTNYRDATITCRKRYERPRESEAYDSKRIAYAKNVLDALNS